ncbi:hypothetical protein INR49_015752 [Caranx melampygus]|nr:hypothetical protein INR49_015752 [Caranx melampygus]
MATSLKQVGVSGGLSSPAAGVSNKEAQRRVARLKLQYKVKMLIFQQQTTKNQKQVLECEKVLQSGRQGTAPSHGGPQTQDTTSCTAGEEVLHFATMTLSAATRVLPNARCTRKQREDFHRSFFAVA